MQQPQSTEPVQKEHIVTPGETVEQIAKNYGAPANFLRQLNKLSGPLRPGQKLRIPVSRLSVSSPPRNTVPST